MPESWETTIAVSSAVMSLVSVILAFLIFRWSINAQAKVLGYTLIAGVEGQLRDNEDLLRVYGVTDDLKEAGLTVEEFLFFLDNCTAQQAYHSVRWPWWVSLRNRSNRGYFTNLLLNPRCREAWRILRERHMIEDSRFSKAVEKYLRDTKYNVRSPSTP